MTSIHKRNAFFIALGWASAISLLLWLVPLLRHSTLVKYFHLPAIWAAFVVSGDSHMPPAVATWTAFIVYGLLYWALVLVIYVVLLEITLVRRLFTELEKLNASENFAYAEFPEDRHLDRYLANLGTVIADIERKRRHHWLLADLDFIDLNDSPERIGAAMLTHGGNHRVAKMLLRHLDQHLAQQRDPRTAQTIVQQIKARARDAEQGAAY